MGTERSGAGAQGIPSPEEGVYVFERVYKSGHGEFTVTRPRGIIPVPFLFSNPQLIIASLSLSPSPSNRERPVHQRARDVPQCMALDQSEGAIPKVYLLWLEPGRRRGIKGTRPQPSDSL